MKNPLSLIALLAAIAATPSFADQLYIGAEIGELRYGSDSSSKFIKEQIDSIDDAYMTTLKIGSQFGEHLRVYGYFQGNGTTEFDCYNLLGAGTKFTMSNEGYQYGIGVDYLYRFLPRNYLTIGGRVGHYKNELNYSISDEYDTVKGRLDFSGLTSGISATIGHEFTDHLSLELGYRYEKFENDDKYLFEKRITFDDAHQAFVGVNYTF
ncbi:outer membrane protein [Salinivibrio sp. IB872]|uniref:outer membrane protein n=1 Tax=Salinivibrio sp. IB872 TaxID=1766123 RepID=UPI000987AB2D|nr:outer membrane beta-barrel protein [Salinivibrio sp. IB872]OOF28910.1 hypothetical protein BZJ18_03675 [Salinivibrio sp. IB872]